MMLTLHRSGAFRLRVANKPEHVCGPVEDGLMRTCHYKVHLTVTHNPITLGKNEQMLIRNEDVQKYFEITFPMNLVGRGIVEDLTCEQIALKAVQGLREKLTRMDWKPVRVSVQISGRPKVAWLEATWEAK